MHSILQHPKNHVPLNTVDTATVFKMITNPDLNPNYQLIQTLRTFKRSDPQYRKIKKKLQCFTPNASFSNYVDSNNGTSSSGFVFMDFDPKNDNFNQEQEMDCLKNNPHVYACWTSAGGTGIGCLLKADWTDTTDITFKYAFTSAFDTLKSFGSSTTYLDKGCKDITRLNFISYSNVYVNVDAVTIEKPVKEIEGDVRSYIYPPSIKDLASPFPDSAPPVKLFYRTEIHDWNPDEPYRFYPEGKKYVNIFIGKERIPIGHRTTMLFITGCKLAVINHGATEQQLFAHVWSLNKRFCVKPKTPQDVTTVVRSIIKLRKEGKLYAYSSLKYVWFNPAYRLTTKQKQSVAARLIQTRKKVCTLDHLTRFILTLRESGIKITQKSLAESSGKSVRTVKRYWDDLKEFVF